VTNPEERLGHEKLVTQRRGRPHKGFKAEVSGRRCGWSLTCRVAAGGRAERRAKTFVCVDADVDLAGRGVRGWLSAATVAGC
jgi:hypothetical protein